MAKFRKLNAALSILEAHLDRLEAEGVDITKLATGKRNLVAECGAAYARNLEAKRAKANAKTTAEWAIGDVVRTRRGETGTVTAIEGHTLALDIAGTTRKFAASLVFKA